MFLVTYWSTGRLCLPSSRLYLVDQPNERSLHITPVPRTGGIAILASILLGQVSVSSLGLPSLSSWGVLGEAGGGSILWIIGIFLLLAIVSFWDDTVGLSATARLGIHALGATAVVWQTGLTVDSVFLPSLGSVSLGWLTFPFTVLFIMWLTNLYNFMDGMDGFAAGMTVIGFGFYSYLAWSKGHPPLAVFCILIAAAAAGFLLHNLPTARIFLGDVGSVSLGFLVGVISVLGIHERVFDIWVPILIFSPFIVDATVTLFRRLLRREKIWQAHRQHYYQRLVVSGWSHRKTVMAEYLLMLACGTSALLYSKIEDPWRMLLLLGWLLTYSLLAYAVHTKEKHYFAERTKGKRAGITR